MNGVDLQVSVTNEGGPKGPAPLLHGFPELAFSWRHQIPVLAEAGYEVWAPNLRGYGESSKPPKVSDYTMDRLLADIAALIDAAGREGGDARRARLGGVQAWMFAIRRVRPLQRLVIMNVPHPACMQRELRSFRQLRKSWYIFFFQIPWLPEKVLCARRRQGGGDAFETLGRRQEPVSFRVTDVYRQAALRPAPCVRWSTTTALHWRGIRQTAGQDFGVIDVPTLMVWGLEDVALSKETTDGTDRYVADLTLRFLPEVSHWVQQEAPETVGRAGGRAGVAGVLRSPSSCQHQKSVSRSMCDGQSTRAAAKTGPSTSSIAASR